MDAKNILDQELYVAELIDKYEAKLSKLSFYEKLEEIRKCCLDLSPVLEKGEIRINGVLVPQEDVSMMLVGVMIFTGIGADKKVSRKEAEMFTKIFGETDKKEIEKLVGAYGSEAFVKLIKIVKDMILSFDKEAFPELVKLLVAICLIDKKITVEERLYLRDVLSA